MPDIRPQPGGQEQFLSSSADIAIYGGAAYAGKTYGLLLEPLRHIGVPGFSALCFRRDMTQVTQTGGLWDTAREIYPQFGLTPIGNPMEYRRKNGTALIRFAGIEHEKDVNKFDGAQIPLIMFDQLESFTYHQFFYLMSRNRSLCGVVPYIRATCNPNPDSWLARFIGWWIDQDTGYPIKERGGVVRYFVRRGEILHWSDTRKELRDQFNDVEDYDIKSATFIPGTIFDNKIGLIGNPEYLGNLKALSLVERERLLGGNWKIRAAAGLLYRREWCPVIDTAPDQENLEAIVRGWDLAATEATEQNNPAWTVGVKLARYKRRHPADAKRYVVLDVVRRQASPAKVQQLILDTAEQDGHSVRIRVPQDPGQAGKDQAQRFISMLSGYDARARQESGDKQTRFLPFSAQAESANIDVVRGHWNDDYYRSLEAFPDGAVKDDADASSAAFDELLKSAGPISMGDAVVSGGSMMTTSSGSPWELR
jgi:predicted phage terminase large subunit-like protein